MTCSRYLYSTFAEDLGSGYGNKHFYSETFDPRNVGLDVDFLAEEGEISSAMVVSQSEMFCGDRNSKVFVNSDGVDRLLRFNVVPALNLGPNNITADEIVSVMEDVNMLSRSYFINFNDLAFRLFNIFNDVCFAEHDIAVAYDERVAELLCDNFVFIDAWLPKLLSFVLINVLDGFGVKEVGDINQEFINQNQEILNSLVNMINSLDVNFTDRKDLKHLFFLHLFKFDMLAFKHLNGNIFIKNFVKPLTEKDVSNIHSYLEAISNLVRCKGLFFNIMRSIFNSLYDIYVSMAQNSEYYIRFLRSFQLFACSVFCIFAIPVICTLQFFVYMILYVWYYFIKMRYYNSIVRLNGGRSLSG